MHLSRFGTIFGIPSRGANQVLAFENMHEEQPLNFLSFFRSFFLYLFIPFFLRVWSLST
jgi:hypothetical protein